MTKPVRLNKWSTKMRSDTICTAVSVVSEAVLPDPCPSV